MISLDEMSPVSLAGGWFAVSPNYDEFNIFSEAFGVFPARQRIPLIKA